MGLESKVLSIATAAGIAGAYFYEGTLFVPANGFTDQEFFNFELALENSFPVIDMVYSDLGSEVAIDFAGSKRIQDEFSPFVTMNS